jgi:hypothetical protein
LRAGARCAGANPRLAFYAPRFCGARFTFALAVVLAGVFAGRIHFFIAGCARARARVLLLSAVGARLGASLMIGEL